MKKRVILGLSVLLACAALTGCWNYRGINELDIVTGAALDWDAQAGLFQFVFEIADVASTTSKGPTKTKHVESTGGTLLEAIRNAKKKLINKLYFGNMQVLVISHQIAQTQGILPILQAFIRDGELRETLKVIISQEDTARDILLQQGIDALIVSYGMQKVVEEDNQITISTVNVPVYKAYSALIGQGLAMVLPAFHVVINNEKMSSEANGAALFTKDKLIGFLSPEETKYFLFAVNAVEGGGLGFREPSEEAWENVSLKIIKSKTKAEWSYDGGQLKIRLNIRVQSNLSESSADVDPSKTEGKARLELRAAEVIKENVARVIAKMQNELGVDVFGFGNLVFKDNPNLWRKIGGEWNAVFAQAAFEIQVDVNIMHTGVLAR